MEHTVTIEKIVHGGLGLARRQDGPVLLARFVLPGETVRLRQTRSHKGFCEAELVAVIDPSPERVKPPCPLYTKCGGCDLQHASYAAQLVIKQEIVTESLQRGHVPLPADMCGRTRPAPDQWAYRDRIRLQVDEDGKVGFFRIATNQLVAVESCPLAAPAINAVIDELAATGLPATAGQYISEIELLRSPADDKVFLLVSPRSTFEAAAPCLAELGNTMTTISGVYAKQGQQVQNITDPDRADTLCQEFDGQLAGAPYSLCWAPGCFSQVNSTVNGSLIEHVLRLAGGATDRRLLDLYCGMGNFAIPLALRGAEVTGIERSGESIDWAMRNAATADLAKASFVAGDVAAEVKRRADLRDRADTIILDPPRQGMGRSTPLLAELNPEQIIYISCDPATLARDLALLLPKGYRVVSITPFDMFPQTHHIETVVLLEKN